MMLCSPASYTSPHLKLWMFRDQNVLVYAPTGPKITSEVARVISGVGDQYTTELLVATGKKGHAIFDWSAIESYDGEARNHLLTWARARVGRVQSVHLILSSKATIFLQIAVSTGVGLLAVLGYQFICLSDPDEAHRKLGIDGR
jgi:hypothetical protein